MSKRNNIIIIIACVAVAVALLLWPRKKDLDAMAGADTGTGADTGAGGSGGSGGGGSSSSGNIATGIGAAALGTAGASAANAVMNSLGYRFPIIKGTKGEHVKNVQRAINANWAYWGFSKKITVDGVFGNDTITALGYDFENPGTVSLGRYNWIMDRVAKGVPIGRRYVGDTEWPLKLGDFDGDNSALKRIRRINIAMNVFTLTSPDPRIYEFGPSTKRAIMEKYKTDKVDRALFNKIIEIGFWSPTLNR